MNKPMLVMALCAAAGSMAFSAGALAQQPTPSQPVQAQATAQAGKATHAQPTRDARRAVPATDSRNCLRSTGSHIPPPKGECLPVAGSSYTQKEIRRTGAGNLGQALQMLDPSVRTSGGGF